jgi:riboflavin kinase/FMN adenylyltransferase
MQTHFGLPSEPLGPTSLTMGSFDGVHLGHQAVLSRTAGYARANALDATWITFDPHPRCVLDPANCPPQITTLEERMGQVEPLGFDHAIVIEFNLDLAALSAELFMSRVLAAMALRHLVAGPDFALGRGRKGNVAWLHQHGRDHGYDVEVVSPLVLDGEEVHSSEVRRLLTLGDIGRANRLLGRPYTIGGLVEPGDRIGRQIGWPTVNLAIPPNKLVPARGIYAGWAISPSGQHQAAISIGYRPTFDKTELRVEAYLLDFEGDLYQQKLELRFIARLREERKFGSAVELSRAIAQDVEETRRLLGA